MAIAQEAGVLPVIVVTKADLVESAEAAPSAVQYVVERLKEGWTYVAI